MTKPVVEVEDLVKRYDGKAAVLDGVSFTVDKGDFVTIFGKSGCGKTTLLSIIGGLDRPTSGKVKIDGQDIVDLSEDDLAKLRLKKVGFVFQDYNLLLDLSVRENIEVPLRLSRRTDKNAVDLLLEKFDISDIAEEPARTISGGEAQRVSIARAMMNNPAIILADEPTGNLDRENTERVLAAFEMVRREFGTTVILATHDEELGREASAIVTLSQGKSTVTRPSR